MNILSFFVLILKHWYKVISFIFISGKEKLYKKKMFLKFSYFFKQKGESYFIKNFFKLIFILN